jgi:4-alpha-glucanotransferase
VRIDHFRGLQAAWEIPASEETAMQGTWVEAPGDALLAAITNNIPDIILIAEDLGIITDEVNALRLKYQLPGMKILQFAFDGSPSNPYLPERIEENSVVYTGTHDNDTSLGWYQTLAENQRLIVNQYFNSEAPDMPNALIELALSTKAKLAIIPMQDILGLDSQHRMNVPGTVEGNWQWRFAWAQLQQASITDFVGWVEKYQRHST